MLNNKSVLITGGTGSFGKKLTERLLNKYPKINRLIIFSRDELKQYEIKKKIDTKKYSCLRFFFVDIRD